jgi:cytosine/adenosine deaminase-related metal-dependent hydrolase
MTSSRRLVRAAMVVDGAGVRAAPGVLLLEGASVVAAGAPEAVGAPSDALVEERRDVVLVPALVNAHAHLDLTHVGPLPYEDGFCAWVDVVRTHRAGDADALAASVRAGVDRSIAGGTAIVGDIAGVGSTVPLETVRASGLQGVSYLEVFGQAGRQAGAIAQIERAVRETAPHAGGVRLGVQPHAPYSCGREVYRAAAAAGCPVATHLAETPEELEFTRTAGGEFADLMRRLGVWDDAIVPLGGHPVDGLADVLAAAPWVAAHVNYVDAAQIDRLAGWEVSVAYCPRASDYFGHPRDGAAPHAYRTMIEHGINVALGTDSAICFDTPDRISVLDEMRHLARRDGTDPALLLRMATVNGARALGMDEALVALGPAGLGVLALPVDPAAREDPLAAALRRDDAPTWIAGPAPTVNAEAPGP